MTTTPLLVFNASEEVEIHGCRRGPNNASLPVSSRLPLLSRNESFTIEAEVYLSSEETTLGSTLLAGILGWSWAPPPISTSSSSTSNSSSTSTEFNTIFMEVNSLAISGDRGLTSTFQGSHLEATLPIGFGSFVEEWHHVAATWNSTTGEWLLWVDYYKVTEFNAESLNLTKSDSYFLCHQSLFSVLCSPSLALKTHSLAGSTSLTAVAEKYFFEAAWT